VTREGLQAGQVSGLGRLGGEPSLQGLPEPFDLALGLRVIGLAVLLPHAEAAQLVLQPVAAAAAAAAGEPGRVDRAVEFFSGVKGLAGGRSVVWGRAGVGAPGDSWCRRLAPVLVWLVRRRARSSSETR